MDSTYIFSDVHTLHGTLGFITLSYCSFVCTGGLFLTIV